MNSHQENQDQFDKGIKFVDSLKSRLSDIPQWAQETRSAMPDWGFEIHCLRWLDGLDMVLRSIRDQVYYSCSFGTYQDRPGQLMHGITQRTLAVQDWLDKASSMNGGTNQQDDWLGKHTPEKEQAAQCFVEITHAFIEDRDTDGRVKKLGETWRAIQPENPILKLIFQGEGLDRGLFSGSSYWTLERLDLILRLISGDQTDTDDILGSCNYELRNVLSVDPIRIQVTQGYLWGLYAYLMGYAQDWLGQEKPALSGSAIHAFQNLSNSEASADILHWLAAALLITTRFWYQRALIFVSQKEEVPINYLDIPLIP